MLRLVRRAFCCLLLVLVFGISTTLRGERLPIRAYTMADGLPHNTVMRVVTDSRGFLWFCTLGGLAAHEMGISTNTVSFHLKLPTMGV